jgi:glycosyltransferase involved in cell wall biosynthesis
MQKKTKVAFFAEILIHDFDGASRTMYQLLDRIPHEEFEFQFFCGVPPDKDLKSKVVTLPKIRIPFNSSYSMVIPHFSKGKIRRELEDFKPDVIHIASPSALGDFAATYAKKNNIPVISIYHTHFITYMKYYFRKLPFLLPFAYKKSIKITQNFYRDIDLVYAPSQQIIDELKDICELDGSNLKLWQRGIDKELFNPKKKDEKYLQNITNNDFPNILFASRLVWEKNLQMLISLYELCEKQNKQVNFIVAGDGVARKEAEAKMPKAHFLGMISHEDLATVYASSDVYFFPSDTESFGNVIIEAMASGLPCVAADGGGPKSLIVDDVSGYLCPPNDAEYYLEKIDNLLENETLRDRIIKGGLEFTDTLSWEKLAETYFTDLVTMK